MTDQKNFRLRFSWKNFLYYSLSFFLITLLVTIIWNYFDKDETVANSFSQKEIIRRLVLSIFLGFFITIWHNPGKIDK